jgi:hypothetical protein
MPVTAFPLKAASWPILFSWALRHVISMNSKPQPWHVWPKSAEC